MASIQSHISLLMIQSGQLVGRSRSPRRRGVNDPHHVERAYDPIYDEIMRDPELTDMIRRCRDGERIRI